ncbi:MAG: hypothetical protein HUK28_01145 [Methanobrevibacter sp.]|nr:hypothetical protein [Methanobrevibacter sp.]
MSCISIVDKDKCQPKKYDYLCIHYCLGVNNFYLLKTSNLKTF